MARSSSNNPSEETRLLLDDDDGMDDGEDDASPFVPLKDKTWSFSHSRRLVATSAATAEENNINGSRSPFRSSKRTKAEETKGSKTQLSSSSSSTDDNDKKGIEHYTFCLIYAVVNVVIAVPGLFGYAAVIFNHPIYSDHMNALSKLLIFSSMIHQLGFFLFSSLPFAIGTVQDAGLIFLSAMANTVADKMIADGHTESEILSTALALLCLGTALLGLVLILMGRFKLADAVSFLPMPVVGGYLAFIGYFCVEAGTSLCIGEPMMTLKDWDLQFNLPNLKLAIPGLITGLVLTLTSRLATKSTTLPSVMVAIPALFYFIVWICGSSIEEVREDGWVGDTSPAVPISDLLHIINFKQVRWDLLLDLVPTWFGMVFVVSFASCLDVAAISIDMGKPLDTNRELATVGICNFMSGMTLGFTGSYIFSQTIFTYRTGVHDRCIGLMIMVVYFYIVASPVNILEVAPLFFLGSTLIFIGYDLMFEWLWEVRHQVFLSEYFIVLFTFASIHAFGINFGIMVGILIAICDQILTTAQSTGVSRIEKRSRAVYTPTDAKIIHEKAYCSFAPRIVTLQVIGNVFFGSSLSLLTRIFEEIGFTSDGKSKDPDITNANDMLVSTGGLSIPPKYVVLDLMGVTHIDASATRGCFLQLAKMAAKNDITICASGLSPRIEWMFRSHGVSFDTIEEESNAKASILDPNNSKVSGGDEQEQHERIILFTTAAEALEFCETLLLQGTNGGFRSKLPNTFSSKEVLLEENSKSHTVSTVLSNFLGSTNEQKLILEKLMDLRYHKEATYNSGQIVFKKRSDSNAFYVVLNGCVANSTSSKIQTMRQKQSLVSGAGKVTSTPGTSSDTHTLWQFGAIFGFNDYLLGRKRTFETYATVDETKLAIFTHSGMSTLRTQDPDLYAIIQQVLLRASTLDLSNCTCHDV